MFKIVQRVPKENDADQQQSPSSPHAHPRADSKPTTMAAVISRKSENPPPPIIKTNIIQKAVEQATKQGTPTKVLQQSDTSAPRKLEASVQLINDEQELLDTIKEFLCDGNKKFRVIGAVGSQGTGKSTTLSMLAGNDPMDMYRQYIFRPCAREAVESCRYQSTKISIFVSQKTRVLFLDCQPLNSVPLLEDCSHSYRSKAGPVESLELESLQLLLLLANVCDTLLLCIDWFIDLSIIRRLMRIELFPSFLQSRAVNLVILHQRAKSQDFQPLLVAERIKLLEGIFANTSFDLNGGLTMSALGFTNYDHIKSSVNYIVLGELKPRTRMENYAQDLHQKSRELDYGTVISKLRTKIQTLPRLQPKMELTEGKWFCQMVDFWNKLKQELPQMTEDGCTIRRHYLADSTAAAGQGPQQRVHHQQEQQPGKEETLMRARKPGPAIMGKHNSHTHRSPGGEWRPKKKTFQPRKMERTKRLD